MAKILEYRCSGSQLITLVICCILDLLLNVLILHAWCLVKNWGAVKVLLLVYLVLFND
jgi:hypothetical protein